MPTNPFRLQFNGTNIIIHALDASGSRTCTYHQIKQALHIWKIANTMVVFEQFNVKHYVMIVVKFTLIGQIFDQNCVYSIILGRSLMLMFITLQK